MVHVITKEHLTAIRKAGACKGRLSRYKPGMPVSEVATNDLKWVEKNLPELAERAAAELSMAAGLLRGSLSLRWFGYGYGYGEGDGSGYGDGDGSGDGYGDGDYYGYGDGDGYGDGTGYGSGDGDDYDDIQKDIV